MKKPSILKVRKILYVIRRHPASRHTTRRRRAGKGPAPVSGRSARESRFARRGSDCPLCRRHVAWRYDRTGRDAQPPITRNFRWCPFI